MANIELHDDRRSRPPSSSSSMACHSATSCRTTPLKVIKAKVSDAAETNNKPQRSSSEDPITQADQDLYDILRDIGSQFSSTTCTEESMLPWHVAHLKQPSACPYHGPILGGQQKISRSAKAHDPMSHFLAEEPSAQYFMFYLLDTGKLSTNKECCCHEMIEEGIYMTDLEWEEPGQ